MVCETDLTQEQMSNWDLTCNIEAWSLPWLRPGAFACSVRKRAENLNGVAGELDSAVSKLSSVLSFPALFHRGGYIDEEGLCLGGPQREDYLTDQEFELADAAYEDVHNFRPKPWYFRGELARDQALNQIRSHLDCWGLNDFSDEALSAKNAGTVSVDMKFEHRLSNSQN